LTDRKSGVEINQGSGLPGNYTELVAQRSAIDARIEQIETVEVPAMRGRWEREAATIGKTAAEVLKGKKARAGRKPKSKSDGE
jgi:hypothetical protein